MSVKWAFVAGFTLAKTMILVAVLASVYHWPNEIVVAGVSGWVALNGGLISYIFTVLHVHPSVGDLPASQALNGFHVKSDV